MFQQYGIQPQHIVLLDDRSKYYRGHPEFGGNDKYPGPTRLYFGPQRVLSDMKVS